MRRTITALIALALLAQIVLTQTPQKPEQEIPIEDVVRITTDLVQTEVVVTDKSDRLITDLKLDDFEVYDNGKKQDLKFMEFVGAGHERRSEGTGRSLPTVSESGGPNGLTAKEVKRVIAFVVDDLTMEIQDLPAVRKMLLDFVNDKMRDGDLVAIVRVAGGKGLLQQFTSDRQLLRRAVAAINITVSPFMASKVPDPQTARNLNPLTAVDPASPTGGQPVTPEIFSATDDLNRYFRGLSTLNTANYVIKSLTEIPGRKDMIIITGGIPIFEAGNSGSVYSNISALLNELSDSAIRAGVVVNTLDPRGLRATPGVVGFDQTPARSALGGGGDPAFGRGSTRDQEVFSPLLTGGTEHLGLSTIADHTGGLSVVNTNNFDAGLDKVLARSNGYYRLAYTPSQKFDNKSHKLEIKVRRGGVTVHNHSSYVAREDRSATGRRTKDEEIAAAARSPLAKSDIDISPNIAVKFHDNKAAVDINLLIGTGNLHFAQTADSKYQTSLDIVGFVFDQMGKMRGGFSETLNVALSPEEYRQALADGLPYTASTEVPPDYYQVRLVVREVGSGSLGTFSKYLEIPNLEKGKLAMGSIFVYSIDPAQGAQPTSLSALRTLSPKQDLRFAATIYNAKLKGGRPQLRSQMIISYEGKVLFTEPEQPVESSSVSPAVVMGQIGLSKVKPGRYLLTLVITDTLADKKAQTLSRSIDFTVGN